MLNVGNKVISEMTVFLISCVFDVFGSRYSGMDLVKFA